MRVFVFQTHIFYKNYIMKINSLSSIIESKIENTMIKQHNQFASQRKGVIGIFEPEINESINHWLPNQ